MTDDLTNFSSPKYTTVFESQRFIVQPAFFKDQELNNPNYQSNALLSPQINFPNHSKYSRRKEKHQKNYKDLNKSLANLASKRLTGRSSSDNDAINYVQTEACNYDSNESEFDTKGFDFGPNTHTPLLAFKNIESKVCQTTAQKHFEMTPEHFYENKQNPRFNQKVMPAAQTKEVTFLDINYSKFQKRKSANYQPTLTYNYPRQNVEKEESNPSHALPPNMIKDFSRYMNANSLSNFSVSTAQARQYPIQSSHNKHHVHSSSSTVVSNGQQIERRYSNIQTKGGSLGAADTEVPHSDTPSFKSMTKTHFIYDMHELIERHTKRRLDQLLHPKSIGKVSCTQETNNAESALNVSRNSKMNPCFRTNKSEGDEGLSEMESFEQLDKNQVSDGVQYTEGGRGVNRPPVMRNNSEVNAVQTLAQDLIKIQKDIEMRKSSYQEVKRFVKLYRNDSTEKKRLESRDMRGGVSQIAYTEEAKVKSPMSSVLQPILNTRQSVGHYQGLRTCGSPIKPQVCIKDMKPKNQVVTRSHANSIGSSNYHVIAVNTESNALKRGKESQKSVPSFQSPKLTGSALMGAGFKMFKDNSDIGKIKMFR